MFDEEYIKEEPKISGKGASFWIDTTENPKYPKLSDDIEVDVAIVGGGFVGILSSLLLAFSGKKVAVLESRNILADVTGHTTAKLTIQHGLIYHFLLKKFGLKKAKDYAKANQTGIRMVERIIGELKIRCDFEEVDSYVYTTQEEKVKELKKEVKEAQKIGIAATFEERIPLKISGIKGAVKFPKQYQFHPRKFLIAVAKKAAEKGVLVFEDSRVTEVSEEESQCILKVDDKRVAAASVIIATNFPIYDSGNYYIKLYPSRSYVLAAKVAKENLPKGIFYGVEDNNFQSFRTQVFGEERLLFFGGEPHKAGQTESNIERYLNLEKSLNEYFPEKKVLYHWSTQDNKTFDRIPYVGKAPKTKNIYLATGFGGWGMSSSSFSAILLSNLILGKETSWGYLFDPKRLSLKVTWKRYLSEGWKVFRRKISSEKREEFEFLSEIEENSGKVRDIEGEKMAVFRDSKGKYHYNSPYCTHKGCVVNWNDAEKTWDCPCHGSRYDAKGKVIHSPAKKDLAKKNIKEAKEE